MSEVKISIIIPIYNMEQYLEECLNSIARQTLEEIEIICVDDASTDDSYRILKEKQRLDTRVKVYQTNHVGAGGARNLGIDNAIGRYVAFLDADDSYCENDALEELYKAAMQNNVAIAGGSMLVLDSENNIKEDATRICSFESDGIEEFTSYQFVWGYTRFIYSRQLLIDHGVYFPDYLRYQDPPFMLYAMHYGKKFAYISKYVYRYKQIEKRRILKKNMIADMLRGYRDIIKFSVANGYELVCNTHFLELTTNRPMFLTAIDDESSEILYLLREMDGLLPKCFKKDDRYYLDWSMNKIKEYIFQYNKMIREFICKVKEGREIIIYGAGIFGRLVYDYISKYKELNFQGFAVSNEIEEYLTERGRICNIMKYDALKNTALLVIAAKEPANTEMRDKAIKCGYKDMIVINEFLYPTEGMD